jgi:DUF4097 and DUF4098 domain-containing protein YvlB
MKKLLLALVVLIVLAVGALAVLNFVFDKKKTTSLAISGKITEIVVKSDSGDVDVASGGGRVEVRQTQHYVVKKPKLKQKIEGGVLTLDVDCDIPVLKCYSDLKLTVPDGIKVTVKTDSGDVGVALKNGTAIDARSDSGDVNVNVGGHPLKIVAKTDSGDVDVAVPAGHYAIDAKTDSGDVKTDGVTNTAKSPKSIEAKSDSGDVKVHAR